MAQCVHGNFEVETPCLQCGAPDETPKKQLDINALSASTPRKTFVIILFDMNNKTHIMTCDAISSHDLLGMIVFGSATLGFIRAVILDEKAETLLHDFTPLTFVESIAKTLTPGIIEGGDPKRHELLQKMIEKKFGNKGRR